MRDRLWSEPGDELEVFRRGRYPGWARDTGGPQDDVDSGPLVELWGRPGTVDLTGESGLCPQASFPSSLGPGSLLLRGALQGGTDLMTSRRGSSKKLSNLVVARSAGS